MIYTLTANPSLDYIVRVKNLEIGETNRAYETEIFAGGKGFNVSTILANLGHDSIASGFIAGFTGDELERLLAQRSFQKHFIPCFGRTRINVKLKAGEETEINGTGIEIDADQVNALFDVYSKIKDGDVLILSGSIPGCLDKDFYAKILESQQGKDVLFVVDASGALLSNALPYHPFLVKPNQAEIEDLLGIKINNEDELIAAGRKLQEAGARNVLISRGAKGALLVGEDGAVYEAGCPQGKLVNSVGSGDSMVAGFVAGWLETHKLEDAFVQGIYCGSATAFCADLASAKDIEALKASSPLTVNRTA